jgi:hypothetical protein
MKTIRFVLVFVMILFVASCTVPGPAVPITVDTIEDGQVVTSNVLVRGSLPAGLNVQSLRYTVNDSDEIDVTATIEGQTFIFSISGEQFVEGSNEIRLILREVGGRMTIKIIIVIYDPDAPPPAGTDVIVFNDINLFDNTAMADANNVRFVQNLVNFTSVGPRNAGTVVLFDRGRNARCGVTGDNYCNDLQMQTMIDTIVAEGFTVEELNSTAGSITSIPANVKMIFLWTPLVEFTTQEVNTLKRFAADGGRIMFIGEWDGYYTQTGLDLQNRFLQDMGALMTNTGGAVDCGYTVLPLASLRPSPLTAGLEQLTIACASVIVLGPNDYALFYDTTNTQLLAGVASIDVTPLPLSEAEPAVLPAISPSGATSTGY